MFACVCAWREGSGRGIGVSRGGGEVHPNAIERSCECVLRHTALSDAVTASAAAAAIPRNLQYSCYIPIYERSVTRCRGGGAPCRPSNIVVSEKLFGTGALPRCGGMGVKEEVATSVTIFLPL